MAIDRQRVEDFIYHEANLADENRYDEWESLWTEDALYWVPFGKDDPDPSRDASIIYDNRGRISSRLHQLKSDVHWIQDPPSRMRRLITNILVEEIENGELLVNSNFMLVELRQHQQNLWAGRTIHKLRPDNGTFKMALKKVLLVNNAEVLPHLSILL
ncbi:MAG: aromatic-ring-hydroxylating dioxygenase subunit beta [Chloroflexota bacterium]